MLRLVDQIRQALEMFGECSTPPALIGGLAMVTYGVNRSTEDVDFLVDAADSDKLHDIVVQLGYRCIYRSADAANYRRDDEGLDFLYAHRPIARKLLGEARMRETPMGRLRVVSAEALIGFKLQAYANNPTRLRDLEDIRYLLREPGLALDMQEVREYFRLFQREDLLDELAGS